MAATIGNGMRGEWKRAQSLGFLCLFLAALIGPGGSAHADPVTDWNAVLEQVEKASEEAVIGRPGAILHTAIFDAVNGIERRYAPYHVAAVAPRNANPEVAADYAAFTALVALYPEAKEVLTKHLSLSLQPLSLSKTSPAWIAGKAWGEKVARTILVWRSKDGFDASPPPFYGKRAPGQWRPTPPSEGSPGFLFQLARATPFVMRACSQFRPAPPPALTSAQYAADIAEIKSVGGAHSARRTAEQTRIAEFNNDASPIHWNRIARSFVKPDADLLETARLFALLNLALADTDIVCFDAKYTYNFWRPITAIQQTDPKWRPLLPTPTHPDYISRHCALAGAAATILIHFFGDKTSFRNTSDSLPGVTRTYANFTALCKETIEARVLGGIHFRTADVRGDECGRKLALYVLATQLALAPASSPPK